MSKINVCDRHVPTQRWIGEKLLSPLESCGDQWRKIHHLEEGTLPNKIGQVIKRIFFTVFLTAATVCSMVPAVPGSLLKSRASPITEKGNILATEQIQKFVKRYILEKETANNVHLEIEDNLKNMLQRDKAVEVNSISISHLSEHYFHQSENILGTDIYIKLVPQKKNTFFGNLIHCFKGRAYKGLQEHNDIQDYIFGLRDFSTYREIASSSMANQKQFNDDKLEAFKRAMQEVQEILFRCSNDLRFMEITLVS